jgi:hypothetical protein
MCEDLLLEDLDVRLVQECRRVGGRVVLIRYHKVRCCLIKRGGYTCLRGGPVLTLILCA